MKTKTKLKFIPIPKDIGDYVAYSEESKTGLVWRVNRGNNLVKGKEVGSLDGHGYYSAEFEQKAYKTHRIIYFLKTGVDPEEKRVDHIDTNPSNNKISNLRLATNKQNGDNRKKGKNNTSGVTGVFWCKRKKRYKPSIRCDGKLLNLGSFIKSDKDKAIAVRIAAETDPRFKDQEFRHSHNDKHAPSPEMLVWAKQYLEDRIERLCWDI